MDESLKLITNPSIVFREEFDDWALLYNPDKGTAYGLNPTGVLLWKSLDGSRTVKDLTTILSGQCDSIPVNVNADIEEFLSCMLENGVVRPA